MNSLTNVVYGIVRKSRFSFQNISVLHRPVVNASIMG